MLSVVIAPAGLLATFGLTRVARRVATVDRARRLATPRSRIPERLRARLEHELRTADVAIAPADALQWWGIATAAAAVFGCALSPAVGVIAAGSVVIGAPLLLVAG